MEIDKATRHTERHTSSRRGKTRANFSWHRGWLRPVSQKSVGLYRYRGREGRGGKRISRLWSEHTPFLHTRGYPWTPFHRARPSPRPPPRQALSGNAQIGLEISNLHPPARHLQGLELFSDFHISISTPSAQVWNPRSFVPNWFIWFDATEKKMQFRCWNISLYTIYRVYLIRVLSLLHFFEW